MVSQQVLDGDWNEIKGKLRKKWGQLTDNDLPEIRGGVEELVGIIQRKTGEGREAIESYLRDVGSEASSMISAASERGREYAHQAAESVEEVGRQTADQIRAGYTEAQRFVRSQPGLSLGVCFGAGMVAGLLIALTFRGGR